MIPFLNAASGFLALVAAGFWLWSTTPKLPVDFSGPYWDASPPEAKELLDALRKQSLRNALGAAAAAGAALCQVAAALVR